MPTGPGVNRPARGARAAGRQGRQRRPGAARAGCRGTAGGPGRRSYRERAAICTPLSRRARPSLPRSPDRRGARSPWWTACAATPRCSASPDRTSAPLSRTHSWPCTLTRSRRCSAVVLSGSLPPGLPAGLYAEPDRGLPPARGAGAAGHAGEALLLGSAAGPAIVKPNLAELTAVTGGALPRNGVRDQAAVAAVTAAAGELAPPRRRGRGGDAGRRRPAGGDGRGGLAGPAAGGDRQPTGAGDAAAAALARGLASASPWPDRVAQAAALGAAAVAAPAAGEFAAADFDRALAGVQVCPARGAVMPLVSAAGIIELGACGGTRRRRVQRHRDRACRGHPDRRGVSRRPGRAADQRELRRLSRRARPGGGSSAGGRQVGGDSRGRAPGSRDQRGAGARGRGTRTRLGDVRRLRAAVRGQRRGDGRHRRMVP